MAKRPTGTVKPHNIVEQGGKKYMTEVALKELKFMEGMRLTDCCGACSTFDGEGILYCKSCGEAVGVGQGDGCEYLEPKGS